MNSNNQTSLPEQELREIYYDVYAHSNEREGVAPVETGLQAVANAAHVVAWNEALTTIKQLVLDHDAQLHSDEFGRLMKVLDVVDICTEQKIVE